MDQAEEFAGLCELVWRILNNRQECFLRQFFICWFHDSKQADTGFDAGRSFFRINHLENKLMILACILGFLLQFAVTEVPFLIQAFGTSPLSGREWMRLVFLAAAPLFAHEMMVLLPGKKAPFSKKKAYAAAAASNVSPR